MTALGDFTSGDVLTAADMNAIATWQDFTPTFDNVTVGNGTITAQYAKVNELVFWRLELTFGSTTAFTGSVNAYFPVAADAGYLGALGGSVFCEDNSGVDFFGSLYRSSSARASVRIYEVSGSYIASDAIDATTPFTWTTNDRLLIEDYYRPA